MSQDFSQDQLKLMLNLILQMPMSYKLVEIMAGVHLTKDMEGLIKKLETLIKDKPEPTTKA